MEDEELKKSIQELNEEDSKKWLYHTTLELHRYQDLVSDIFNFLFEISDDPISKKIFEIIKERGC